MQNNQKNSGNAKIAAIQFTDTDDLLDIRYDNIFKAVFTQETPASKGALSGLISALIERKVIVEVITANEPPVEDAHERNIHFDISCKTESGEKINIEMIFNPKPNENVRLEYFASKLFNSQSIRGIDKSYSDLKETYQIAIIAKERMFSDDILVHTFQYYDPVHNISLRGKTRIITVELLKAERIVDKHINEMETQEAWAVFFQYLTDREKRVKINEILERKEEIAMAGETLITISRDERERARLLSEEKYILDKQNAEVLARREGIEIGHAEGMQEGRKEGRAEGIQEERQRFLELLDQGLTAEEIKRRL